MFFGIDLNKKNLLWPLLVIVVFFYLEWHFTTFEPLNEDNLSYSNSIRLANNFIVLLSVLNQFYWLVKENDSHVKDIKAKTTELEQKNVQLERNLEKTQELQAKNKDLVHFAYIASHDLNEPLRTVDSFVEMIHDEYADASDENISTYFSFIHEALNRMRTMIDGLFNYSRIGKSGNFELIHINQLVREIEQELKELILEKKAVIKKNDLPAIVCLPLEIRQLFQNLISNAIKFQPPETHPVVQITCENMTDYWKFCVADNGIGISPKKHTDIFKMFTKLHLPTDYKGQGIGLAFCKEIIDIHKGKIWVESLPGEGSKFYFTISKNN